MISQIPLTYVPTLLPHSRKKKKSVMCHTTHTCKFLNLAKSEQHALHGLFLERWVAFQNQDYI